MPVCCQTMQNARCGPYAIKYIHFIYRRPIETSQEPQPCGRQLTMRGECGVEARIHTTGLRRMVRKHRFLFF